MQGLTITGDHDFYVAAATTAILVHNCGNELEAGVTHDHHIFAQAFRDKFAQAGIDIDEHTVTRGAHLCGIHGRGMGDMPGGWNVRWAQFFDESPAAAAKGRSTNLADG